MTRTLPVVSGEMLVYSRGGATQSLNIGSAAWYTWLEEATAFAFADVRGTFTARKERASNQCGGAYWYAYRKQGGKLDKVYLGRSEDLAPERLNYAAATLAGAAALADPDPARPSDLPHAGSRDSALAPPAD